jgi:hypothetical protein
MNYGRNNNSPATGEEPITALQPRPAEIWLSSLDLSPKSRGHVRGLLHVIWDYAMWSGSVAVQANPISLVNGERLFQAYAATPQSHG